jgi:inosine-uridine nucleoside N-ribohydrolase
MAAKIILDCDPGVDDALAIVFAHGSPDVAIAGITTVAGNVTLDKTTGNALRIREFLGADWPVTAGCPAPLLRPAITAGLVHGADGLGAAVLPPPVSGPEPGHATDFIIDTVRAAPGEISLVATGPLTNIALALRREPKLPTLVRDFRIMGGSSTRGNVTPAAEFNIAVDPEAAAIVFDAGWTVTMVGLDVTLRALATADVRARIAALGRLADDLLLPCLRGYIDGADAVGEGDPGGPADAEVAFDQAVFGQPGAAVAHRDPAVHDVCAVAHVAHPDLLGCVPARVDVETAGRLTAGMTVTDFRAPRATCNALVATTIDTPSFWDVVIATYFTVAAALPPH